MTEVAEVVGIAAEWGGLKMMLVLVATMVQLARVEQDGCLGLWWVAQGLGTMLVLVAMMLPLSGPRGFALQLLLGRFLVAGADVALG